MRILIVDDHPIVRAGFAALIERESDLELAGQASNAAEALALVQSRPLDLAILDIVLHGDSSLKLGAELRDVQPTMKLLVCSAYEEHYYADMLIQVGATGYLNKNEAAEKLIRAIRAVAGGELYFSPELAGRVLAHRTGGTGALVGVQGLSERERMVFLRIGAGQSVQKIADDLQLSPKTVESYRESIKRKLDLHSGADVTRYAMQWNLDQSSRSPGGSQRGVSPGLDEPRRGFESPQRRGLSVSDGSP